MKRLGLTTIAALGVALSLPGCADTPVYAKPGSTRADFTKDTYECERDMRVAFAGVTGLGAQEDAQAFDERCMLARGWTIKGRQ